MFEINTLNKIVITIGSYRISNAKLLVWALSTVSLMLFILQPASPLLIALHFSTLFALSDIHGYLSTPAVFLPQPKENTDFWLMSSTCPRLVKIIGYTLGKGNIYPKDNIYWNIFYSILIFSCTQLITYSNFNPYICMFTTGLACLALFSQIGPSMNSFISILESFLYESTNNHPISAILCASFLILTGVNLTLFSAQLFATILYGASNAPAIYITSQKMFQAANLLIIPAAVATPTTFFNDPLFPHNEESKSYKLQMKPIVD